MAVLTVKAEKLWRLSGCPLNFTPCQNLQQSETKRNRWSNRPCAAEITQRR